MSRMIHEQRRRLTGALALLSLAGAIGAAGCNTNVVEPLQDDDRGPTRKVVYDASVMQDALDILWVVDNSFSMCEEQKVLRDNFDQFTSVLEQASLDFHIALTTTHAPEGAGVIEPIAREALIQSTPQPVPGNNIGCVGDESDDFAALRESLAVARRCLADTSTADQYNWTTAQIACALRAPTQQEQTGCVASSVLPDRNNDSRHDVFDLFPDYSAYRPIPKVLRAEDYRLPGGALDVEKLKLDFSCMATVGTRGDGYEKGLRAAVNAVSKELTGGAVGLEGSIESAPNHGFIRPDAGFSLIFVTDENDCSHNGEIEELGNACGSNICEYMNSKQVVDAGQSKLVAITDLAQQLRDNLAATKGLASAAELNESELFVASINGSSRQASFPEFAGRQSVEAACQEGVRPEVAPACESVLGSAYSGDRYERFMRQFRNFYPNQILNGSDDPTATRLDFSSYEPIGWMCTESFAPALKAIAEFIVPRNNTCLAHAKLKRCGEGAACGSFPYEGGAGVCDAQSGFCSDSVVLMIVPDERFEDSARRPLEELSLCLTDSIDAALTSANESCVVSPSAYRLDVCARGPGVEVQWSPGWEDRVEAELAGYRIDLTYNVHTGIEE